MIGNKEKLKALDTVKKALSNVEGWSILGTTSTGLRAECNGQSYDFAIIEQQHGVKAQDIEINGIALRFESLPKNRDTSGLLIKVVHLANSTKKEESKTFEIEHINSFVNWLFLIKGS